MEFNQPPGRQTICCATVGINELRNYRICQEIANFINIQYSIYLGK